MEIEQLSLGRRWLCNFSWRKYSSISEKDSGQGDKRLK